MLMKKPLTIGRLAKTAGVNIETIRYYERRGIIEQPPTPAQGFRTYPQETLVPPEVNIRLPHRSFQGNL